MPDANAVGDMKVLITGASGLIGSALVPVLEKQGHEVVSLTRSDPRQAGEFRWDPEQRYVDPSALEGVDAVVHLAGETVAGRWTEDKKRRILESRAQGTRLVSEAIAGLERRPGVMVCASAIGFYGDRGAEPLTEESTAGRAASSRTWCRPGRRAAEPARAAGIRVVHTRFGIVQSARGGALKTQLPLFRLGLGGRRRRRPPVRQHGCPSTTLSAAIAFALSREDLSGAVNVTAPGAVTQAEYARTLGRVLRRPAVLPAPAFAVRAILGEFANEVLEGQRVIPKRLRTAATRSGTRELEPALRHVLARPA